jgi:hypothetical protein
MAVSFQISAFTAIAYCILKTVLIARIHMTLYAVAPLTPAHTSFTQNCKNRKSMETIQMQYEIIIGGSQQNAVVTSANCTASRQPHEGSLSQYEAAVRPENKLIVIV